MKTNKMVIYGLCMLMSGLGTGWLIGLSVSPVVHIVIGTLLSLLVALISALAGLETVKSNVTEEEKTAKAPVFRKIASINPIPVTVFIIGLAIGSSLGVYARTNEWLGMNIHEAKQRWIQIGFDDKEIKALYLGQYPPNESEVKKTNEPTRIVSDSKASSPVSKLPSTGRNSSIDNSRAAGIFAISAKKCDQMRLSDAAHLKRQLTSFDDRRIDMYLAKCDSDSCLVALRDYLCSD